MRAAGDRQAHGFGNRSSPGGCRIERRRVGTGRKESASRSLALIGAALAVVRAHFGAPLAMRRRSIAAAPRGTAATKPRAQKQSTRSNNQFKMRPKLGERCAWLAANVNVHVAFGDRGVWIGARSHKLGIPEQILQLVRAFPEKNHARSGVSVRAPEIIAIVAANRRRQTERRSEVVNRARFAVIPR